MLNCFEDYERYRKTHSNSRISSISPTPSNTGCHIRNRHLFLCSAIYLSAIGNILFATIYAYLDTVIVESCSFYT